jgi:electron transfer flavoprotein beta subunit
MNILVCVKQVPETAEADLAIADSGDAIETDDLVFGISEWDNYAVEEAIRLKDAHGGHVTAITLGNEEADGVLRRALAMGADEAIHLSDDDFVESDPAMVARALAKAIHTEGIAYDLVLTGVQSADLGHGQTGVMLAQLLDLPHATLAVGLEVVESGGRSGIIVRRELEANTYERVQLPLPALVTVQSGINQPRYVSIMGIRKVRSKAIDTKDAQGIGLGGNEIGADATAAATRALRLPQASTAAEMLKGSLGEVCTKVAHIIKEKGSLQ